MSRGTTGSRREYEAEEFEGTDRFRIERHLGEGGMGTVYLAYDRERDEWVALKLLRVTDSEAIYSFKQEFRAVADVSHDNLVNLYELFSEGDRWFFTMEYVEGEDFLDYVHVTPQTPWTEMDFSSEETTVTDVFGADRLKLPCPIGDMTTFRTVLVQIAEAIRTLHASDKLHRDLKPENVIVDRDGRAVVLDFGIAVDRSPEELEDADQLTGTPVYMSPEQAAGEPIGPASDWYAFGVMMYEALCGTPPFDDDRGAHYLLAEKQLEDAGPPSRLVAGIPEDLEALCMRLVNRDPAERPSGRDIVSALRPAGQAGVAKQPARPTAEITGVFALPFVARKAEQAALKDAFSEVQAGRPVVALIGGPPGIGKTTLARRFLMMAADTSNAVVLSGRCHEYETMSFNALDSVIDAVSRYLRRLPATEATAYLPRHLNALVSVFPVLGRVGVVEDNVDMRRFERPADPLELRRLAFSALKELMRRMAHDAPTIMFIDNLHWGDADSATALRGLLSDPDPPPVMWLATYRPEAGMDSVCVEAVKQPPSSQVTALSVTLEGLTLDESKTLADALAKSRTPAAQLDGAMLATESGGNPYLLTELVQFAMSAPESMRKGELTLQAAIGRRLDKLSVDSRELLEMLAIYGRPMGRRLLGLARRFDVDLQHALTELRGRKLVQAAGARSHGAVQIYHDGIRDTVRAQIPEPKQKLWHQRLARAIEAAPHADLETLATHFLGAGQIDKAVDYAVRGARQAVEALAFDRATRLYRLPIDHPRVSEAERRLLLTELAGVVALSGRRADAANQLLRAAADAPEAAARQLRRRAGRELLLSGHVTRGMDLLREALDHFGFKLHDDLHEAVTEWIVLREQIGTRGFDCEYRTEAQMEDEDLQRIDTLWAAGMGLLRMIGPRSYPLVAHHLLQAFEKGDTYRVVRGLALYSRLDRPSSQMLQQQPQPVLDAIRLHCSRVSDPRCDGWRLLAEGYDSYFAGRAVEALDRMEAAEETFVNRCVGSTPEIGHCRSGLTIALHAAGRWADLRERHRDWLADEATRDDVVAMHRIGMSKVLSALLDDAVETADAAVQDLVGRMDELQEEVRFQSSHLVAAYLALYMRDPGRLMAYWDPALDYLLSVEGGVPMFRGETLVVRARCALALSLTDEFAQVHLDHARQDIEELTAAALPCKAMETLLLKAALANIEGQKQMAIAFAEAATQLEDEQQVNPLVLNCARWFLGCLHGGDLGADFELQATRQLSELGVRNVERWVRSVVPGCLT